MKKIRMYKYSLCFCLSLPRKLTPYQHHCGRPQTPHDMSVSAPHTHSVRCLVYETSQAATDPQLFHRKSVTNPITLALNSHSTNGGAVAHRVRQFMASIQAGLAYSNMHKSLLWQFTASIQVVQQHAQVTFMDDAATDVSENIRYTFFKCAYFSHKEHVSKFVCTIVLCTTSPIELDPYYAFKVSLLNDNIY